MLRRFDILVAGEINPDLILSGNIFPDFDQVETLVDSASLTVGSSCAIFACGAARLGLKVAFAGLCGPDLFGQYMLAELSRHGVDTTGVRVDPQADTGVSVILSRGSQRAILTYPGCMADLHADQVSDDLLRTTRHLHVGSYFLQTALQAGLPDLFRRAHRMDLTTSLDPNWDPSEKWGGLRELLGLADVFLPNEKEAIAISGALSGEQALEWLGQQVGTVAMKCGVNGAMALRGGQRASASALHVEPVDTVGAGDTFDAGFLYGFLNDWTLEKSLHLAAACGSLSTRAAGGTAGQPCLEEAMSYVQSTG